ncbi:hypothetical protein DFJ73DRAFT_809191 [Zopfochytrium polystomum]|nr:hypothetical protein DFJ73DRAFT_809191 [Zopfochytrium polystomum]
MEFDATSAVLASAAVVLSTIAFWPKPSSEVHPAYARYQIDMGRYREPNESAIIRNRAAPNGAPLFPSGSRAIATVYDLVWESAQKNPQARILESTGGSLSRKELASRAERVGSGLLTRVFPEFSSSSSAETPSQPRPTIALIGLDDEHKLLAEIACMTYSLPTMTVAADDGNNTALFKDANVQAAFVGGIPHSNITSIMKAIVVCSTVKSAESNEKVLTLDELSRFEGTVEHRKPTPGDTFIYTVSNGAKVLAVSHRNFISAGFGFVNTLPINFKLGSTDCIQSRHGFHASLSHALLYHTFWTGGAVRLAIEDGVLSSETTVLFADAEYLSALKNSIESFVSSSNWVGKRAFLYGLSQKQELLEEGICTKDALVDSYILKSIRKKFARNIRLIVSIDAVTSEVASYIRSVFGCQIVQAFDAIPEVFGGGFTTLVGDYSSTQHLLGVPFTTLEYKLKGTDYTDLEPRGEILLRGPIVANVSDVDGEGWLHSGQYGKLLPDGKLVLL